MIRSVLKRGSTHAPAPDRRACASLSASLGGSAFAVKVGPVQPAASAQSIRRCGPAPKTPGAWRCVGRRKHGENGLHEQTKVGFTFQKIEYTWADGGKTASVDSWSAQGSGKHGKHGKGHKSGGH
ncbi:MAG: hypothetical protein ACHP7N_09595 [Caulobacterales bacterium]